METAIRSVAGVLCLGLILWAAETLWGGPGAVLASAGIGLYALSLK